MTSQLRLRRCPRWTNAKADELAYESLTVFQLRRNGPFRMTIFQIDAITLDEDGLWIIVSADDVSLARCKDGVDRAVPTAPHGGWNDAVEQSVPSVAPPAILHSKLKNIFDKIVRHCEPPINRRYTSRWYELAPNDGTDEPAHHIYEIFFTRYWQRIQIMKTWIQAMVCTLPWCRITVHSTATAYTRAR